MQIKMSLTIYTVVRLVLAIDNTGWFIAYGIIAVAIFKLLYKACETNRAKGFSKYLQSSTTEWHAGMIYLLRFLTTSVIAVIVINIIDSNFKGHQEYRKY
jgi:hypothetical protein